MDAIAGIADFVKIALIGAAPLILAAIGGFWSERSGVADIALEGKMLLGALLGVLGTYWTGNPWLGCLPAILGGVALATVHWVNCEVFDADHLVSGAAVNIVSLGLTGSLVYAVFASKSSPQVPTLPRLDAGLLAQAPALGPLFSLALDNTVPLFFLALAAALATSWVFRRTPMGLRIRAVGEDPAVAASRGIHVRRTRLLCLIVSGALAGLAGAQLSIGSTGVFSERMSAGRGFMALAALIFGRWKPLPAMAACLFFGFADAAAVRLKLQFQFVSDELALSLPFILTLAVLCFSKAGLGVPSSLGRRRQDYDLWY